MNSRQLNLFEDGYNHPLLDEISKILNCQDKPVLVAACKAISNFLAIPNNSQYILSFSGGKDSHVLLGIYNLYLKLGFKPINLITRFADTELEYHSLYQTIGLTQNFCVARHIPFEIVKSKQSYWYVQFALGYPVPNHFNRWCTGKLKIQPLQPSRKLKSITGRHFGESNIRDNRLKSCGTDNCGEDKLKKSYEPIVHYSNCLIWDSLFYFDDTILYPNVFNLLKAQYEQAEDTKTGSLRMGCFMCPVISLNTIKQNVRDGLVDKEAIEIRLFLEELRQARRIRNYRTKKNGAIYIVDRRLAWSKLKLHFEYLLKQKWIKPEDIITISESLKDDYSYPPTYPKEWIEQEHRLLHGK